MSGAAQDTPHGYETFRDIERRLAQLERRMIPIPVLGGSGGGLVGPFFNVTLFGVTGTSEAAYARMSVAIPPVETAVYGALTLGPVACNSGYGFEVGGLNVAPSFDGAVTSSWRWRITDAGGTNRLCLEANDIPVLSSKLGDPHMIPVPVAADWAETLSAGGDLYLDDVGPPNEGRVLTGNGGSFWATLNFAFARTFG